MSDLSRFGEDPTKNTKNMRGKQGEKSLKPTRFDYTCARSSKHKREIHDSKSTREDTKGLLREEVLKVFP